MQPGCSSDAVPVISRMGWGLRQNRRVFFVPRCFLTGFTGYVAFMSHCDVLCSYYAHSLLNSLVFSRMAGQQGRVSDHSLRVDSAVASLVEMQVDGRWKDSRMPSHYASAEIAQNSATARIKYGKRR